MSGDMNTNNQVESFDGNILGARKKVVWGTKRDDSVILKGLQIHHNFIRSHLDHGLKQVEDGHPECRQIRQLLTLSTRK